MNKSTLLRAATLTLFVFLIGAFVAYRTGKLDSYFTSGNNISNQTSNVFAPSEGGGMMALANTTTQSVQDSPPNPAANTGTIKMSPAMMSTSKSAVVIPQQERFVIKRDSPKHLKDSVVGLPEH